MSSFSVVRFLGFFIASSAHILRGAAICFIKYDKRNRKRQNIAIYGTIVLSISPHSPLIPLSFCHARQKTRPNR